VSDDVLISAADQERIDAMVAQYRHSIEHLYRIAYLQGQIDEGNDALRKMKERAPC
jgi:hypothetical protein